MTSTECSLSSATMENLVSDNCNLAYSVEQSNHQENKDKMKKKGDDKNSKVEKVEVEGVTKWEQVSAENGSVLELPDSDLDEVLAESPEITLGEMKVVIKQDFFVANRSEDGRNSVSGDLMTYDPTPPSRKQVIGSTLEYLEKLKAQPEKTMQLVPIFTQENLNKPSNMYWNYPRAVIDYSIFEELMVPIISNGAVKKLICKQGRDAKLSTGDNVLINYYIYVEGCPNCVESNKRKRKPHSFVLGKKRGGIPVIGLGTLSMRVKEIAAFLATPEYGYGMETEESWIPPNKRVLCIIEVLSRLASPLDSSSIINLVPAERKLLQFDEIFDFSMERKNDANKDLKKGKVARAMRKYLQAVTCLQDATPKEDVQIEKQAELNHSLFSNIAICGVSTGQMDVVIDFSLKAIALPIPEQSKALDYFRVASVYYRNGKWRKVKEYLETALPLLQGASAEKEARIMWNHIENHLSRLKNHGSNSSLGSSSSSLYSTASESSEPHQEKSKEKKRSSSFCKSFLLRRLSSSDSSSK